MYNDSCKERCLSYYITGGIVLENNELIARAVDYAKQHATSAEITVQDIASNAGFSIDYFNRIFQTHTGFTVMAYVNYIRLKQAAVLLRNTEKTLLEVALEVGYDSHEGFIKAFKKRYGLTPSEYRSKMKNRVLFWGEMVDSSVAAQFVHANPDLRLVDTDYVVDYLLGKDAKRYGYFCSTVKYMGLAIAAPDGNIENGFIGIGDDRKGGYWLELMTEDFALLSDWIRRFGMAASFHSARNPAETKKALKEFGIIGDITATPHSFYFGAPLKCDMPADLQIRPLSYADKASILKWAKGKEDGYIRHLLNESHYNDEGVLEYGVFQNGELIAVAGCGIDEVGGFRFNDSCVIRFAEGKAETSLYRSIFTYVVNDVLAKGVLPFDNVQHGEYAQNHGGFTTAELGFETVNWKYNLSNT